MTSKSFIKNAITEFLNLPDEKKFDQRQNLADVLSIGDGRGCRAWSPCRHVFNAIISSQDSIDSISRMGIVQIEDYLRWILTSFDPSSESNYEFNTLCEILLNPFGIQSLLMQSRYDAMRYEAETAEILYSVDEIFPEYDFDNIPFLLRPYLTNWIICLRRLFSYRDGPRAKSAIIHGAQRTPSANALKMITFEIYSDEINCPAPRRIIDRMYQVSKTRVIERITPGRVLGFGRKIEVSEIKEGVSRKGGFLLVIKIEGQAEVFALINIDQKCFPEHASNICSTFGKANRLTEKCPYAWLDLIVSSQDGTNCLKSNGVSGLGILLSLIAMVMAHKNRRFLLLTCRDGDYANEAVDRFIAHGCRDTGIVVEPEVLGGYAGDAARILTFNPYQFITVALHGYVESISFTNAHF